MSIEEVKILVCRLPYYFTKVNNFEVEEERMEYFHLLTEKLYYSPYLFEEVFLELDKLIEDKEGHEVMPWPIEPELLAWATVGTASKIKDYYGIGADWKAK